MLHTFRASIPGREEGRRKEAARWRVLVSCAVVMLTGDTFARADAEKNRRRRRVVRVFRGTGRQGGERWQFSGSAIEGTRKE